MQVQASLSSGDVNLFVEKISTAFGVAADKVWPMLIHQTQMEGWLALIVCLLGILSPFVLLFVFFRFMYQQKTEEAINFIMAIAGVMTGIFFIVSVILLQDAALRIANPEYYALVKISELVHGPAASD